DLAGRLWIGTANGLNQMREEHFLVYTTAQGLPDNLVNALFADPQGSLWIATNHGLSLWDNGAFLKFGTTEGLPATIKSAYREPGGAVWIGTERGLWRWQERDGSRMPALEARPLMPMPPKPVFSTTAARAIAVPGFPKSPVTAMTRDARG